MYRIIICLLIFAVTMSGCSSVKIRTAAGDEATSKQFLTKRGIQKATLGSAAIEGYKAQGEGDKLVSALAPIMQMYSQMAIGLATARSPQLDEAQVRAIIADMLVSSPAPVPVAPVVVPAPPVVVPADPAPVLDPQAWQSEPLDVDLPAGDWAVRFEVRGLVKEPGPAGDGKAEHIFADLRGAGFRRVLLMNMDGNRELRAYIDPPGDEINHPEPDGGQAVVIIERVGERLTVEIGGESWVDRVLTGTPRLLVVGGTKEDARRVFKGDWRGLEVIHE